MHGVHACLLCMLAIITAYAFGVHMLAYCMEISRHRCRQAFGFQGDDQHLGEKEVFVRWRKELDSRLMLEWNYPATYSERAWALSL